MDSVNQENSLQNVIYFALSIPYHLKGLTKLIFPVPKHGVAIQNTSFFGAGIMMETYHSLVNDT